MKIVVLAGGISTERAVSLVTGTGVCRALRENGHRAILVDLFLGLEEVPADLETLFDAPDGLCPDAKIEVEAPDLETVKRGRKDQGPSHIGPHVLDICLTLHAEHGGGNNSTFTTHVVSSSGTDTYSAIAAALGSLKGPKHGGANVKVARMFEDMKENI